MYRFAPLTLKRKEKQTLNYYSSCLDNEVNPISLTSCYQAKQTNQTVLKRENVQFNVYLLSITILQLAVFSFFV